MGRIRTDHVKIMSEKLLESHPDMFSSDFSKNKEAIDNLLNIESKKLRNVMAGYIAHLVNKKEKLNTLKVTYQPPPPDRRGRGRRGRR
jgi:small subunit ribosomal protein S17e